MNIDALTYDENGLIPVITQELDTGIVLMQAFGNKESMARTLETGKVHYFSRSRNRLWKKGEASGNFQHVKEIYYDCDYDCVLIKVVQDGGACHTGHKSCFYQSLIEDGQFSDMAFDPSDAYKEDILQMVYDVIDDRKKNPKEGSYTNYLFDSGLDKILKKVGEESAEVIIAAKNEGSSEVIYEISDLLFHIMVLMVNKNVSWDEIKEELKLRYK